MSPSFCPFRACFLSPCPFRVGLCNSSKPCGRRHRPGEPTASKTPWQSPHFCSRRSVIFLLTHVILNQDSTLSLNGLHFFLTVQFPFFVSLLVLKSDLWNLVLLCRLVILALRKLNQDYKFKAKLGDIGRPCVNNSKHPHGERAAVPENDHGAEQNWLLARGKVWYKGLVSLVSCEKSHGAVWSREWLLPAWPKTGTVLGRLGWFGVGEGAMNPTPPWFEDTLKSPNVNNPI